MFVAGGIASLSVRERRCRWDSVVVCSVASFVASGIAPLSVRERHRRCDSVVVREGASSLMMIDVVIAVDGIALLPVGDKMDGRMYVGLVGLVVTWGADERLAGLLGRHLPVFLCMSIVLTLIGRVIGVACSHCTSAARMRLWQCHPRECSSCSCACRLC